MANRKLPPKQNDNGKNANNDKSLTDISNRRTATIVSTNQNALNETSIQIPPIRRNTRNQTVISPPKLTKKPIDSLAKILKN